MYSYVYHQHTRRRHPSGVTQTAPLKCYLMLAWSTYRALIQSFLGGWLDGRQRTGLDHIDTCIRTHGRYRSVYLVWVICYQRIATPYTKPSGSLTCPDGWLVGTLAMPSRTLVGPAGVKAGSHLSNSVLVLLAVLGLLLRALLGPRAGAHTLLNQPGSVLPGPGSISDD